MSEIMTPKDKAVLYKGGRKYKHGDKIRPVDAKFFNDEKMMKLSDFEKEKQKEAKKEEKEKKQAEKIAATETDESQE